MASTNKESTNGVHRGAALLGAGLALLVGFYLGFTVHGLLGDKKAPPQAPQAMTAPPAATPPAQDNAAIAERIKAVLKQTQLEPANIAAWTQLGNLYYDSGQAGPAVAAYAKSLSLDPKQPDVLTDQGVMYRQLGKFDEALGCFNKAIEIDPNHIIAHFNKSVVLEHDKHDKAGALTVLRDLAARNPNATLPGGHSIQQAIEELSTN